MNLTDAIKISETDGKAIYRTQWVLSNYGVNWVMVIDGCFYDHKFNQWSPSITEDIVADDWEVK